MKSSDIGKTTTTNQCNGCRMGITWSKDLKAAFRTKQKKIKFNIIPCYAPTNDSDEEDKYDSTTYRDQSVLDKCPVGEFNAMPRSERTPLTGYEAGK